MNFYSESSNDEQLHCLPELLKATSEEEEDEDEDRVPRGWKKYSASGTAAMVER